MFAFNETHYLSIEQDENAESPREWDNLGTMACFHRRYSLGDKGARFDDPEDLREHIKDTRAIALPLYLYDHSGLSINTGGFNDPWDSGQVGVIYVERERVLSEYSVRRISPQVKVRVLEALRSEVSIYDQYLRGDVYGYMLSTIRHDLLAAHGFESITEVAERERHLFLEHEGSCWGFFGYDGNSGIAEHLGEQAGLLAALR